MRKFDLLVSNALNVKINTSCVLGLCPGLLLLIITGRQVLAKHWIHASNVFLELRVCLEWNENPFLCKCAVYIFLLLGSSYSLPLAYYWLWLVSWVLHSLGTAHETFIGHCWWVMIVSSFKVQQTGSGISLLLAKGHCVSKDTACRIWRHCL